MPTLKIQGTASNPAWGFTATGSASASVTTASPILTTVSAIDGGTGRATVTINFTNAIDNVQVQVVLNASAKTDLLVDNFSVSTFTTPLPVELTRFNAAAQANGVGVTWSTASEANSAYFEVQRNATGEAYQTIGKVAA